MPSNHGKNSTAILGAGLVGGAVLREIVRGWVHHHQEGASTGLDGRPSSAPYLATDLIHITATSEAQLAHQLRKTRTVLGGQDGITLDEGTLSLGVRCGPHLLRIEAEVLDILPEGLSAATVNDDRFRRQSPLYAYLHKTRPRTLVIGAGLASIVAYGKELEQIRDLALAWILITLKQAVDSFGIETAAILGTTALGGMGTNLVWTHQSSQEMDSNLTGKILAAYGILGVLDRIHGDSDSRARWILLTPGSLLGYDCLDFGPVTYLMAPEGLPAEVAKLVRESGLKIPLYQPVGVNLDGLCEAGIDWSLRRESEAFLCGATIMCGETWILSPIQFACLSHPFQMGFNTDAAIAKVLLDELLGRPTGYNQIPVGGGKVVEPTDQGQIERSLALARLSGLERRYGRRSPPVYPALGSPRAQKEIAQAELIFRYLSAAHGKPTLQQLGSCDPEELSEALWGYLQSQRRLLAEITAVIPVIAPDGTIYTGPHVMFLKQGVARTGDLAGLKDEERFHEFAALGAVDLRAQRAVLRKSKIYETGVAALVHRARLILEKCVSGTSSETMNSCGSAIDPRIRHWTVLTSDGETVFDPVFFTIQFLGGERPYH